MASNHSNFALGCPLYRTATLILGAVLYPANTQAARPPLVEPPYCETTVNPQGRPPLVKPPYCPPAGDMAPKLVSPPARASGLPAISTDGRYIAYITNIVRKQGEQQRDQIFLWDAKQKNRHLISQDNEKDPDKQGEGNSLYPAISGDGSRVVYASDARDIDPDCADGQMHIYLRIWDQMKTSDCISKSPVGVPAHGMSLYPAISGDGLTVSWASNSSYQANGDVNGFADILVWTNERGMQLASVANDGTQSNGHSTLSSLDDTGQRLAFMSEASNLVEGDTNQTGDIFLRDLTQQKTTWVSVGQSGEPGNQASAGPMISRDGQHVVFVSQATNLVPNDKNEQWDVFVRHLATGQTERVSVADGQSGEEANGDSSHAGITGNGRCVVFESAASNLVNGDANGKDDVFIRDLTTHRTVRVSLARQGREANDDSFFPVISADGSTVAFTSHATGIAAASDRKLNDPDVYISRIPVGLCR